MSSTILRMTVQANYLLFSVTFGSTNQATFLQVQSVPLAKVTFNNRCRVLLLDKSLCITTLA